VSLVAHADVHTSPGSSAPVAAEGAYCVHLVSSRRTSSILNVHAQGTALG
jgi:hypothetical protein